MGGKPEAMAIPRHSGSAIKNTKKPESKSLRQFSSKPGSPVLGRAAIDGWDMGFLGNVRKATIEPETCHFVEARNHKAWRVDRRGITTGSVDLPAGFNQPTWLISTVCRQQARDVTD